MPRQPEASEHVDGGGPSGIGSCLVAVGGGECCAGQFDRRDQAPPVLPIGQDRLAPIEVAGRLARLVGGQQLGQLGPDSQLGRNLPPVLRELQCCSQRVDNLLEWPAQPAPSHRQPAQVQGGVVPVAGRLVGGGCSGPGLFGPFPVAAEEGQHPAGDGVAGQGVRGITGSRELAHEREAETELIDDGIVGVAERGELRLSEAAPAPRPRILRVQQVGVADERRLIDRDPAQIGISQLVGEGPGRLPDGGGVAHPALVDRRPPLRPAGEDGEVASPGPFGDGRGTVGRLLQQVGPQSVHRRLAAAAVQMEHRLRGGQQPLGGIEVVQCSGNVHHGVVQTQRAAESAVHQAGGHLVAGCDVAAQRRLEQADSGIEAAAGLQPEQSGVDRRLRLPGGRGNRGQPVDGRFRVLDGLVPGVEIPSFTSRSQAPLGGLDRLGRRAGRAEMCGNRGSPATSKPRLRHQDPCCSQMQPP